MKNFARYFLLTSGALIAGAVLFLGGFSIWMGISHQERDGFWMPLAAGSLASALILYFFFRFCQRLFRQARRTDSLN